jgi:O-antigen/teichoic acid export membrane protein
VIRRSTRNAGFLLAGELLTRGLGFAVTAVLARRLGLGAFGQIALGMSLMAYGIMVTKAGLLTVGTRNVARDPAAARDLAGQVQTLRLLLAGVAFAGIVLFAALLPRPAETRWLLVLYAAGVFAQALALEWVLIGEERMHHVAVGHALTNAIYFLLVLILVRGPSQLLQVPVAFVVATAAGAGYLLIPHIRRHGLPRLGWQPRAWRLLVRQALPIGAASVLSQLYVNAPVVSLALLRGDAAAGLYSAAHRFVFFMLMLDRVVQSVFLPVAARQYRARNDSPGGRDGEFPDTIGTVLRVALALSLPVCLLVLLLAPQVARLLFGAEFEPAGRVMRILIWFFPLSLASTVGGYTLLAADRERRYAANTAVGVVVALVLIVLGALRFGPAGTALGMVAGEALLAGLMLAGMLNLVRPRVGLRVLWIPAALLPLAGIVLALRDWNWLLAGIAGAAGYAIVLLFARGIIPADLGIDGKQ